MNNIVVFYNQTCLSSLLCFMYVYAYMNTYWPVHA